MDSIKFCENCECEKCNHEFEFKGEDKDVYCKQTGKRIDLTSDTVDLLNNFEAFEEVLYNALDDIFIFNNRVARLFNELQNVYLIEDKSKNSDIYILIYNNRTYRFDENHNDISVLPSGGMVKEHLLEYLDNVENLAIIHRNAVCKLFMMYGFKIMNDPGIDDIVYPVEYMNGTFKVKFNYYVGKEDVDGITFTVLSL